MANLSEDIQCAGSDTRPPMLDRTDFASWQQCIRLYCWGKENGVNILKSIDEGRFQMGMFWETIAEGTEGTLHLGLERLRVYFDLSPEDKERTKEKPFTNTMSAQLVCLSSFDNGLLFIVDELSSIFFLKSSFIMPFDVTAYGPVNLGIALH
ncbi:hypothetical protein Tco_1359334 [Tanacetum coccineum]